MTVESAGSSIGADTVPGATERLALSRERLCEAMAEGAAHAGDARRSKAAPPVAAWLDVLRVIPGAGPVVDAVRGWWARHPACALVTAVDHVANDALRPIAQRRPLTLVLGAFVAGGAIAWLRPWRLLAGSALAAGLIPRILHGTAAAVPAGSWFAALAAMTSERRKASSEPRRSAVSPAPRVEQSSLD